MVRFTDAELEAVEAASAKDGLVLASWLAEAGLTVADTEQPMAEGRATRAELDVLEKSVYQVSKVGNLLNQQMAAFHRTGEPPEDLAWITRQTWQKVARLDDEVTVLRSNRRQR